MARHGEAVAQDFPVPWWYELQLCTVQDGPVRTAEGLLFDSPLGLDELSTADTVIIPGCADRQDNAPEALLQALRTAYDRGARIASICTGAFILAAAGLLDGRTVTTHWMHAGELTRRWPAVRVEPNVLYTDDGQILTSAGSAAGLDLCLHIVCNDHGTSRTSRIWRSTARLGRSSGPTQPSGLVSGSLTGGARWRIETVRDGGRLAGFRQSRWPWTNAMATRSACTGACEAPALAGVMTDGGTATRASRWSATPIPAGWRWKRRDRLPGHAGDEDR
jgi:transcriptional regulator GlxA family with amidase domain